MSFGVSFADATLFGWVDQSHNTETTTTKAGVKTTTQKWGASQGGTSALGVKGEEDLGDGLKAVYLMELAINADTNTATTGDTANGTNRQSYVGLEGAFGGIKIGRQYTPSFNAFASVDPSGVSGFDGYIYINGYQKSNGFYYTSPSLSGFNLILGMHEGESTTAGSNAGNANTFGLTYAGGPLNASITQETTTKGTASVGLNAPSTGNIGSASNGENKLQTIAATYDLGVAKIGVIRESIDSSSDSSEVTATHFSVAVPMGSFTLGAIVGNGSYNEKSTSSVDMTSVGITADYAMSKRTKVYFRYGETTDKIAIDSKTEKASMTVIGLFHSF